MCTTYQGAHHIQSVLQSGNAGHAVGAVLQVLCTAPARVLPTSIRYTAKKMAMKRYRGICSSINAVVSITCPAHHGAMRMQLGLHQESQQHPCWVLLLHDICRPGSYRFGKAEVGLPQQHGEAVRRLTLSSVWNKSFQYT